MAPLNGIKVVDLTHLLPGELCSTLLSDMGAEVLRVEPLKRTMGQQFRPLVKGHSLYFWSLHRNKQRIGLNLKITEGLDALKRLLQTADVLLENFRPGVLSRLGLSEEVLRELNPRLIYCSISGYGHENSWSAKPGHDLNFIAESGVLSMNARQGEKPILPSVLVSDYMASQYACIGLLGKIIERNTTNLGGRVDISMLESAIATMAIHASVLLYEQSHPETQPVPFPRELPNYSIYECADGRYLAVASLEEPFWKRFCELIGLDDLADDHASAKRPETYVRIEKLVRAQPLTHWRAIFENENCCVSPVNTVLEALAMAPLAERKVVHDLIHPDFTLAQVSTPVFARSTPSHAFEDRANHTKIVLRQLGYADNEIESMQNKTVIE